MGADDLTDRVVRAAEAALADHQYVSAIDVLVGMRLLEPTHVNSWRQGRVNRLESVIQGNLHKISRSMAIFREWARSRRLEPSETRYFRHGRGGKEELRFSKSGDRAIEQAYRTHYISPALKNKEKLKEKLNEPPERVVFEIVRDSQCSECGAELGKGRMLWMDRDQPLCLPCSGLGDLAYLASGDAALTRRATKHSDRKAVVVWFSRTRGRYERQGILVEEAALAKAEEECFEDAPRRAAERKRDAALRMKQDGEFAKQMALGIVEMFPGCPPEEAEAIAAHTAVRGSGRVGRTAAGRALQEEALVLAVQAAIRHRHTDYEELLARGLERGQARQRVRDRVEEIAAKWRAGLS